MARRRIAEQPASRLAIWARRLAVFSLPVVMLAIIIARAGLLEIEPVLATFAAALAMAVIAILMALVALGSVWRHGIDGLLFQAGNPDALSAALRRLVDDPGFRCRLTSAPTGSRGDL